jgi:hypothetical protein
VNAATSADYTEIHRLGQTQAQLADGHPEVFLTVEEARWPPLRSSRPFVEIHLFCSPSGASSALGASGLGFPRDAKLIHGPFTGRHLLPLDRLTGLLVIPFRRAFGRDTVPGSHHPKTDAQYHDCCETNCRINSSGSPTVSEPGRLPIGRSYEIGPSTEDLLLRSIMKSTPGRCPP